MEGPERPASTMIGLSAAELTPLSEAGLQALDAAVKPRSLDESLLTPAPASELFETITALLRTLHLLQRPTEGDADAQLEFDRACKRLPVLQKEGRERAAAARRAGSQLWGAKQLLRADQQKLEDAIELCRTVGADTATETSDPALFARFQHRCTQLVAMRAAQARTLEQLELAMKLMTDILARHTEVEQMLLPIWQQAVLAPGQRGVPPSS